MTHAACIGRLPPAVDAPWRAYRANAAAYVAYSFGRARAAKPAYLGAPLLARLVLTRGSTMKIRQIRRAPFCLLLSLGLAACGSIKGPPLSTGDAASPGTEMDAASPSSKPDAAATPKPDAASAMESDGAVAAPPDSGSAPTPDAAPAGWPSYQSTVVTGSLPGVIWDLAVAPDGSIYVAGIFKGAVDFDPGPKAEMVTALAAGDVYVTKWGADGSYQWSRTVPATGDEPWVTAVACSDGGVFLTGSYKGMADFFPGQPGAKKTSQMTDVEGYVLKLNGDGSFGFVRTFPAGSSTVYDGSGLRDGGVVVVAGFYGMLDLGSGPANLGAGGGILIKLSATGTTAWGRPFIGQDLPMGGFTSPLAATEAPDGAIWTAGSFAGRLDLDPGTGVVETMAGAAQSLFVVKLTAAGAYTAGSGVALGAKEIGVRDLAVATDGSVYLAGHYAGPSFPQGVGAAAMPKANGGGHDAYLAKVGADGKYQWGRSFGGPDYDYLWSVLATPDGGVLATGLFRSPTVEVAGQSRDQAGGSLLLTRWSATGEGRDVAGIGPKLSASPTFVRAAKDGFVLGGIFYSAVDFNPRPADKDEKTPIGQAAFVSKYAF